MTRIEIFEKEKEYITHEIFYHRHCTVLDSRMDDLKYISVEYDQIQLSPTEINKIISRYGDRYAIKSFDRHFIIYIDLADKLKDAEPKRHVVLHPFDKILVRSNWDGEWSPDLLDRMYDKPTIDDSICRAISGDGWAQVIPYNEDTAHLIGTDGTCPFEYEIEFKKY